MFRHLAGREQDQNSVASSPCSYEKQAAVQTETSRRKTRKKEHWKFERRKAGHSNWFIRALLASSAGKVKQNGYRWSYRRIGWVELAIKVRHVLRYLKTIEKICCPSKTLINARITSGLERSYLLSPLWNGIILGKLEFSFTLTTGKLWTTNQPTFNVNQSDILRLETRDHFTVVCPVTWRLNSGEAEGELVFIDLTAFVV